MLRSFRTLDRVLKGEMTRPDSLRTGSFDLPVGGLVVLVLVLGAIYGLCMGSFALTVRWTTDTRTQGFQQLLASGAKVPMLFVLTLVVTFPSLYVFNALVGSRLTVANMGRLMVAALAIIMAILASFGTIVVFFSLCTTSYPFMVLLNVAMFSVAGLLGMRFLLQTLHRLSLGPVAQPPLPVAGLSTGTSEPPAAEMHLEPSASVGALDHAEGESVSRHVRSVFQIWIIVFGLVGAQMAWVLRPFIGSPNTAFTFFREREGNVFQGVTDKVVQLMSDADSGPNYRRDRR